MATDILRPRPIDEHPLKRRIYRVPTPSIKAMIKLVDECLFMFLGGALIHGRPRIGKLKFAGEQDPVQIFAEAQRRGSKRGRKQGTLELQLGAASAAEATAAPPARAARPAPSAGRTPVSPIDLSDLTIQNR